jgi:putative transposase
MVREYLTVFGAIEPETGEIFYYIQEKEKKERKKDEPREKCFKSREINKFMDNLSKAYADSHNIIICDNAWWHKSKYTVIPSNVTLLFILPYTPEMNPIEQIWREVRSMGFNNKYFTSLRDVEQNLIHTLKSIPKETVKSITQRDWIKTVKAVKK